MIEIISGGQTGADRAGLDVAIQLKLLHGGWCPAGRKAEDGRIPDCYNLKETDTYVYETRTEMNVRNSDGTIVFTKGILSGGSALTIQMAQKYDKPCLHIDLNLMDDVTTVKQIRKWLKTHKIKVLNIAGSRESESHGIYKRTKVILLAVFN
ncbi:MAG: putative molybdenum carrier protein [Planctomycetota bacterium]